jgi:hypothetical protein
LTHRQEDRLELDVFHQKPGLAEDLVVLAENRQRMQENPEKMDRLAGVLASLDHLLDDPALPLDTRLRMANTPPRGARSRLFDHVISPALGAPRYTES